jgi:hypothetical protein
MIQNRAPSSRELEVSTLEQKLEAAIEHSSWWVSPAIVLRACVLTHHRAGKPGKPKTLEQGHG